MIENLFLIKYKLNTLSKYIESIDCNVILTELITL